MVSTYANLLEQRVFTKEEFNSHRIGLRQQHGRCFILTVLEHQYGGRDVMRKRSISTIKQFKQHGMIRKMKILCHWSDFFLQFLFTFRPKLLPSVLPVTSTYR